MLRVRPAKKTSNRRVRARRAKVLRKSGLAAVVMLVAIFAVSLPVQGLAPLSGFFFNSAEKYHLWFQSTSRLHETRLEEKLSGNMAPVPGLYRTTSVKYPYPDKHFVMTEKIWNQTLDAIESGNPDWFDAEVVRQRAVLEGFPEAMNVLAWMYEHGRATRQNFREAFLWYVRAERAGVKKPRGKKFTIFTRDLTSLQKRTATSQLADELKVDESEFVPGWESINLQILAETE